MTDEGTEAAFQGLVFHTVLTGFQVWLADEFVCQVADPQDIRERMVRLPVVTAAKQII